MPSEMILSTPRLVLVDQRSSLTVVLHVCHEILDPRAASSSKGVASMPEVIEAQAVGADQGGASATAPGRARAGRAPWRLVPPRRGGAKDNELLPTENWTALVCRA